MSRPLVAATSDVDGELARIRQQFSRHGEALDVLTDTLSSIAVFIGIAVAVGRASGLNALWLAGGLLLLGMLIKSRS